MQPGSIWIQCNALGQAACPHCGKLGWFRGDKWGGCEHAVGLGSVGPKDEPKPALIYRGKNANPHHPA